MHMCYKLFTPLGYIELLTKNNLGPKLTGGWARGASHKIGNPYFFATAEASNFKFGTQLGFGE